MMREKWIMKHETHLEVVSRMSRSEKEAYYMVWKIIYLSIARIRAQEASEISRKEDRDKIAA
jgi:hypothetical protein